MGGDARREQGGEQRRFMAAGGFADDESIGAEGLGEGVQRLGFVGDVGKSEIVGSNSSLVAPVSVGAGTYVGSGSVITKDVAPDALAVARGRQMVKDDWAKRFRAGKTPR